MPDPNRAVSEVLGFILIFGFLVISWTVYQGVIVPEQNREVELNHNQQVQNQLQDLRNSILTNAYSGTKQTVSVNLGASYPDRTLTVNLGVSAGAIGTVEYDGSNQIRIANAESPSEASGVGDYWNGSPKVYSTKAIAYQPVYSFYTEAPVTYYENTLVVNDFGDETNLTVTDQALIDGNRITLVSLQGDYSQNGQGAVSIDPQAVSIATNRVALQNDDQPITITIPTRLSAEAWTELLAGNAHVLDVEQTGPQEVTMSLEPGTTYELRMVKVGIGTGVEGEPAKYIVREDTPSQTVTTETNHSIAVQVRDRFNNPVTGFPVNASISGDGTFDNGLETQAISSGIDGEATFQYTAPDDASESEVIEFSIYDGEPDYEVVELVIEVISIDQGPPGQGGPPDGAGPPEGAGPPGG
mgnify:CR=1 FL=1